ncbi:MAG: flagellar export chaperone FliS [Planctomycetes bacterium]|nr:flagellar export chaperone FliS [Planctomycetota bacterium]
MDSSARDQYLETEVMTATPQRLQVMLIDAALRSIEQTRYLWQQGDDEKGSEALIRAQRVVTELLGGLDKDKDPDLVKKVASIYLFLFRTLVDAHTQHSEQKLDEARRVLEIERETWQQVCLQLGSSTRTTDDLDLSTEGQQQTPISPALPVPHLPLQTEMIVEPPVGGFSMEM